MGKASGPAASIIGEVVLSFNRIGGRRKAVLSLEKIGGRRGTVLPFETNGGQGAVLFFKKIGGRLGVGLSLPVWIRFLAFAFVAIAIQASIATRVSLAVVPVCLCFRIMLLTSLIGTFPSLIRSR